MPHVSFADLHLPPDAVIVLALLVRGLALPFAPVRRRRVLPYAVKIEA
jgi:hypothetical protein